MNGHLSLKIGYKDLIFQRTKNNFMPDIEQQQEPAEQTESTNIISFEGSITIQFPETSQALSFNPRELLRGDNKWSYPFPVLTPNTSLSELVDLMGAEFLKELIMDSITNRCQMKWRNAVKGQTDITIIKQKFIDNFFEMKRDLGITSIKIMKLATEKLKEYAKAKRTKVDKMALDAIMMEYHALNKQATILMMEEMKAGIVVKEEDDK